MNKTLYNKIIKACEYENNKRRKGYGNYMVVNSKIAYEINRLNTIQNRKRKLDSLK